MSMLTPPGMGGKYRITGNQYPRMRRPRSRRRLLLAVVATVVVVGLIGYGTLQLIDVFGGGENKKGGATQAAAAKRRECRASGAPSASASSASPVSTALPQPGSVTINVYNATSRSGLAKDTADALAARGFRIGAFGNAPSEYDRKVKQSALLLGGTKATAAVKVVSAQLAGTVTKIDPKRSDATVDLMIGKAFKKLSAEKAAAKALKVLATAKPSPAPSPSGSC
jgi:hypothetical protein